MYGVDSLCTGIQQVARRQQIKEVNQSPCHEKKQAKKGKNHDHYQWKEKQEGKRTVNEVGTVAKEVERWRL